jgi:hypothetical protein
MEILSSISLVEHDHLLLELHKSLDMLPTQSSISTPNHHLRVFLPFLKSLLDDIKQLSTSQQKILFRSVSI